VKQALNLNPASVYGFLDFSSHYLSVIFSPQKSTFNGAGHYDLNLTFIGYPSLVMIIFNSYKDTLSSFSTVAGYHLPDDSSKRSTYIPSKTESIL